MSNKEFLQWIYDRLQHVHKENVSVDYMLKLKSIIGEKENTVDKFGNQYYAIYVAEQDNGIWDYIGPMGYYKFQCLEDAEIFFPKPTFNVKLVTTWVPNSTSDVGDYGFRLKGKLDPEWLKSRGKNETTES